MPDKFKKFLRERNLSREFKESKLSQSVYLTRKRLTYSFKKDKTIKRRVRFSSTIDDDKRNLISYRKNNKTVLADAYTLREITRTKKYSTRNIKFAINLRRQEIKTLDGKQAKVNERILKLNTLRRTRTENYLRIDRSTPLKKIGRLIANITFIGRLGQRATSEGGSASYRDLTIERQYNIALKEAIRGAWASPNIRFSPKDFYVNWIQYRYYRGN